MDRIEIKKYESQALAIAMVILVVSSLIGISIYSRSLKDKGLVLEERASAEALEVSDLVLDKLTQYPINTVIDAIVASENLTEFNHQEGIVLKDNNSGSSGVTSLLRSLGVLEQNISLSELINPLCPITTGSNEYQVTLRETDEHTSYEVKPGNVWSLPVKNLVQSNQCKLNLKFSIKGDSRAGFVLTYIYCKYDENGYAIDCKEYAREDIQNYCFSDDGIECNNENFLDSEWIKKYNENGEIVIEIVIPPFGGVGVCPYNEDLLENDPNCVEDEVVIPLTGDVVCPWDERLLIDDPGCVEPNEEIDPLGVARSVSIDDEGSIYVAGDEVRGTSGNRDWVVRKYKSDGNLDNNWGNGGEVVYDSGSSSDYAYTVAIDSNRNIYVGGNTAYYNSIIRKYNSSGNLDTAWGSQGTVIFSTENGLRYCTGGDFCVYPQIIHCSNRKINSIQLDKSGGVYAVGGYRYPINGTLISPAFLSCSSLSNLPYAYWEMKKYLDNGSLDTAWGGGDGVATLSSLTKSDSYEPSVLMDPDIATTVVVNSDNQMFVGGSRGNYEVVSNKVFPYLFESNPVRYSGGIIRHNWAVRAYSALGKVRTSWGSNGMINHNPGSDLDFVKDIAIDDSNNIYVSGVAYPNATNSYDWIIRKYSSTGSLVTNWGSSGTVKEATSSRDVVSSMVIDPNRNIYVAGSSNRDWVVRKYNSNGSKDSSWANSGTILIDTSTNDSINDIAIDSSRNIYIVGNIGNNWTVKKYRSDGSVDPSWNIITPPNPSPVLGISEGYSLSEIRVKAIFGTIGVSYSLPSECITGLRMYQLRATANCSGVYRGKEIIVPEAKWHNTLFDYVLFNGKGSI